MKKVLLLLLLIINFPLYAQIKTVEYINKKVPLAPYDSIQNCLEKNDLEKYIGQTFYVPKHNLKKEYGYLNFKKDITGKVYKPMKYSSCQTEYDEIAGKYFNVIDVIRNTRAYINDVYLELEEKESRKKLYYDYKYTESDFPFIVLGYYEKQKKILVGRSFMPIQFKLTKKQCVDYYIREGDFCDEMVMFNDSTTEVLKYAISNDEFNREVLDAVNRDKKIESKLKIGIKSTDCIDLLGLPKNKNITEGSYGINEQWIYDDKYLYFENGVLTAIQKMK